MKNKPPQILVVIVSLYIVYIVGIIGFACRGLIMSDSAPFYKKIGDSDARFLPLVDPYKAVKPFGESGDVYGWYIDVISNERERKMSIYTQISRVEKVAVDNGIIMAYSSEIVDLSEQEKGAGLKALHWFVIIPSQQIETGFESEKEFLIYVHALGIKNPIWLGTDEAFQKFKNTGCLDWISDCK